RTLPAPAGEQLPATRHEGPGAYGSQNGTGFRFTDRFGVGAGNLVPQGLAVPAAPSLGVLHHSGSMGVEGRTKLEPVRQASRKSPLDVGGQEKLKTAALALVVQAARLRAGPRQASRLHHAAARFDPYLFTSHPPSL